MWWPTRKIKPGLKVLLAADLPARIAQPQKLNRIARRCNTASERPARFNNTSDQIDRDRNNNESHDADDDLLHASAFHRGWRRRARRKGMPIHQSQCDSPQRVPVSREGGFSHRSVLRCARAGAAERNARLGRKEVVEQQQLHKRQRL